MTTTTDWGEIADKVEGTTMSVGEIAERFDLSEDEETIEVALEEQGHINVCPGCGWWWNDSFLDGEGYCEDCQAEEDDDDDD